MVSKPNYSDVFEQHVWGIHGFFAYRLGSRAEAEDLTQVHARVYGRGSASTPRA
jgi:DNA-directed RNA polymerase specialized sigma24 family protein